MSAIVRWILIAVAVVGAGAVGYWLGHRAGGAKSEAGASAAATQPADGPVAGVSVVPVRRGTIDETVTAYGTVVSQMGDVRSVSVAFEARVSRIRVTPGQPVAAGDPLIDVEPTPATRLALQEAQNAATAAERDLAQVRQRYDQKLATNQELNAAETALRSTQARLQNLQKTGAAGPEELKAEAAGVVSKIDVQPGQVAAASAPLVEVAAESRIEVRVGVEPGDAPHLRPGQPVRLTPVGPVGVAPLEGHVRLVTQQVNPATRLVDVFVALPQGGARLMLETFVHAELTLRSAEGLIVPRGAALPEANAYALYTVENGHAVKHVVRVGIDNDRDVQVEGGGLHEGQLAVDAGNYELEDGMAVAVRQRQHPTTATTAAAAAAATRRAEGAP